MHCDNSTWRLPVTRPAEAWLQGGVQRKGRRCAPSSASPPSADLHARADSIKVMDADSCDATLDARSSGKPLHGHQDVGLTVTAGLEGHFSSGDRHPVGSNLRGRDREERVAPQLKAPDPGNEDSVVGPFQSDHPEAALPLVVRLEEVAERPKR